MFTAKIAFSIYKTVTLQKASYCELNCFEKYSSNNNATLICFLQFKKHWYSFTSGLLPDRHVKDEIGTPYPRTSKTACIKTQEKPHSQ
ncbi:hypothetical protein XENTR_v10014164 [Xenopus tropicalis]|nr:hypothetical protein XENTR_v10014164 [Xenopus tropicalis]